MNGNLNIRKGEKWMDIGALSMAMSQTSLQSQVGIALTKMTLNAEETLATNMTELMENIAVDPNVGQVIDATV